MPDITSVLERAAATPERGPDIDGPRRRMRLTRVSIVAGVCVLAVICSVVFVSRRDDPRHVVVETPTTAPAPTRATAHGATIDVLPGWHASAEPLNYWIGSPYELFSISTVPLPLSPPGIANDAVCPGEIANTVAQHLPADGAYLWITLWRRMQGLYQPTPWNGSASAVEFTRNEHCDMPNGLVAYNATLRRGEYDLSIAYVLGPDASAGRRAEMNQMLDSLDLSGATPTNPTGEPVYP